MFSTQLGKATIAIPRSLRKIAIAGTALTIIFTTISPSTLQGDALSYFVLLLILAGIFHGASDYFMFKALEAERWKNFGLFNGLYLAIIVAYVFVWIWLSKVALIIFLVTSIYHFGQSNWHQYALPRGWLSITIYLSWGAFVLLTPLLIHMEEANSNLQEITNFEFALSLQFKNLFLAILLSLNTLGAFLLHLKGYLTYRSFSEELYTLFLLYILFCTTPLLLGFAVYFTFWHSTYAMVEQIKILSDKCHSFTVKEYFRNLLIMTGMALVGLAILYFTFTRILNNYFGWGMFFLFISLITIPHSYFMDKILKE